MSENDNLPAPIDEDDGPQSALMALPPHLLKFVELRENEGLSYEECVKAARPEVVYANPKDTGWRWYWRKDVQAAVAEMRAEAVRMAGRGAADVLEGIWETRDRCLQRVRPKINRKGEHETTETPDGEPALAYEFDANGAMRASELLANYHGLTKTRTEVSGPNGGPIPTENTNFNVQVPDDPVEASRVYMDMIQGQQDKK